MNNVILFIDLRWVIINGLNYADGRTRTGTAFATAPSRQRVYQIPPHRLFYNLIILGNLRSRYVCIIVDFFDT